MIKQLIIFFFFIEISGFVVRGQNVDLILSKEHNETWFDTLKSLPLSQQIDFIKVRIINDTNIYNSNYLRFDRINIDDDIRAERLKDKGNISEGRILYFIRYKHRLFKKYDFIGFQWSNSTETSLITGFHDFLAINKIKDIEIIKEKEKELAIFGSIAEFGVIIIDLTEKKYLNEFNKLIKNKALLTIE
jgi:hypothetical protein